MNSAHRQGRHRALLAGVVLTWAGAAVQAAPLAEKVSSPKTEKVYKGKAAHYIERRAEPGDRTQGETGEVDLSLPVTKEKPASESSPLELKGVRG